MTYFQLTVNIRMSRPIVQPNPSRVAERRAIVLSTHTSNRTIRELFQDARTYVEYVNREGLQ